jgi:FMN reductase
MLWSTAGYHGTLAGVTKNAIDFFQLLSGGDRPYLQDKAVGLIATAGGDMAAVNAANAMVHAVHSLRGTLAPLLVAIPKTWSVVNPQEDFIDKKWEERLEQLGRLVVSTAGILRADYSHVKV